MAGDWIKMRCDLATDPAVIAIAAATGLDEDTTVGKLHRLWAWADQQTRDGNAHGVTEKWIDRFISAAGFAQAMAAAGWLVILTDGVTFPNWDRHNGQSGKQRALTAKRVARYRGVECNDAVTPLALAREEKRREEKKPPIVPQKHSGKGPSRQARTWRNDPGFTAFWGIYPRQRRGAPRAAYKAWEAAVREKAMGCGGRTEAIAYILERAKLFAESPKGKGQYCPGPAPWLNQGHYDDDPAAWEENDGRTRVSMYDFHA